MIKKFYTKPAQKCTDTRVDFFFFFTVVREVYVIITDFTISPLPLFGYNTFTRLFLLGGTHRLDTGLYIIIVQFEKLINLIKISS